MRVNLVFINRVAIFMKKGYNKDVKFYNRFTPHFLTGRE